MTHLGDRMREGAAAGLAATAAMSAFMWSAQRAGFVGEQAPKQLMRRSLEAVGDHPSGARLSAISLVAHFAFGAAAGAAYGGLSDRLPTGRSTLYSGVAFGLAVWAATYKVAFPPLHLMPPQSLEPIDDALAKFRRGMTLRFLRRHIRSLELVEHDFPPPVIQHHRLGR